MNTTKAHPQKKKVVFIMGASGTGKSRLSVDLATYFSAEIINSDKIQVYKGLDIVTNKIPKPERQGVPHHLLGQVDPASDFTVNDFCDHALLAIEWIIKSGCVPIIVGGSNSFIEKLVEDPSCNFRAKYDCCFIWLDVSLPVLHSFVAKRVDQMVHAGLVDEVRGMFVPWSDNTLGIRRAIGVPEMDRYFLAEKDMDETSKKVLLEKAIDEIKANTCKLVCCQTEKIQRLRNEVGWVMHRIDPTKVFEKSSDEADTAWEEMVLQPSFELVNGFLNANEKMVADNETMISTSMDRLIGNV